MIEGVVEIWKEDQLIATENNLLVDGAGELLADIMTVTPSLEDISELSSILDASNYTIQAISFGSSEKSYKYNAHTTSKDINDIIHSRIAPLVGPDWPPGGGYPSSVYIINTDDSGGSSYTPTVGLPKDPMPFDKKLENYTNVNGSLYVESDTEIGTNSIFDYFLLQGGWNLNIAGAGLGFTSEEITNLAILAGTHVQAAIPKIDINLSSFIPNYGHYLNLTPSACINYLYNSLGGYELTEIFLAIESAYIASLYGYLPLVKPTLTDIQILTFVTNYILITSSTGTSITFLLDKYFKLQLSQQLGAFSTEDTQTKESTKLFVYNSSDYTPANYVYETSTATSYFNTVSSMDMFGHVNMVMSSVPHGSYSMSDSASGLVVSADSNFSSNGIIEYSVKISPGDLMIMHQYGGLFNLGLWSIDNEATMQAGNNPPYPFSVLNNPRKYKLFCKKIFSKDLTHIIDYGASPGYLNYQPLTIKWRLHLL